MNVTVGSVYRHYKQGHIYRITGLARSGGGEGSDLVIYRRADDTDPTLWYRTVTRFSETVSSGVKRFELVPEEPAMPSQVNFGPPQHASYHFNMPGHNIIFNSDGQCMHNRKVVSGDAEMREAIRALVEITIRKHVKETY